MEKEKNTMQHMNCIVLFNKDRDRVLFCKRTGDPYAGKLNFVGGKVEEGETSEDAASRELEEETGIGRREVSLYHFMDMTYYHRGFVLELYVGRLDQDRDLREEKNPLVWLPLTEDFTDKDRFAGEQNIAHIINVALTCPIPGRTMIEEGRHLGIDYCRKGWLAAALDFGGLSFAYFDTFEELMAAYPDRDACLVYMAIGLPESPLDKRPDNKTRLLLGKRGSAVAPIPCRQAVYAEGKEAQAAANRKVLDMAFSRQTEVLVPRIREVDTFLETHPSYKNFLCESQPDLCFSRISGLPIETKKDALYGVRDRAGILAPYFPTLTPQRASELAKANSCRADDVMDAAVLALTACMQAHGYFETVPAQPDVDSRGLRMQVVIPRPPVQKSRQ